MKKYILLLFAVGLFNLSSYAQHIIKGRVTDISSGKDQALAGAFIRWQTNMSGTFADDKGYFEIEHKGESPYLVVSYIAYTTDTFHIEKMSEFLNVHLYSESILPGATIRAKRITYGLSSKDPKFTITLDEREFQKAACCNLSESFENAPAIDVSIGDAVTGTKQIKMLGLDGFYTLISKEYMPAVRTLNSYYGLSFIPASWVNSIQITKGAGSIVNGYESIAGQINIEMKKPFDAEKIMVDQFVSQAGRSETDLMYRWDLNKYVAASAFARIALYPGMQDNNQDGFMDMPAGTQYSLMNRWKFYTPKQLEGQFSASYMRDDKKAGQTEYFSEDKTDLYGINIDNEQWDLTAKLGKSFKDKPYKSFGSQYNITGSNLVSRYGNDSIARTYEAKSNTYYVNLLYQNILGNSFHSYQTGVSFLGDVLNETLDTFSFNRTELVPGAFFEYTYKPSDSFSLVLGLRADYNSIYGLSATPRIHTKYRFNKGRTALRASAGIGRRTSNIFAQNQYILASSRTINIIPTNDNGAYGLDQEVAFNTGASLEHKFKLGHIPSIITADYFHTSFYTEVIVDRENEGTVQFYNVENGTYSNSLQFQLDLNPLRRTDIRLAYRMFDVKSKYLNNSIGQAFINEYQAKPFIAKNRGFINITQATRSKWQFSATLQLYGKQRIPGYTAYVEQGELFVNELYSDPYQQINLQVSKQFKSKPFEVYLGVENLLNYKQANPIISSEEPFNPNFDAGMVWGPIFGRMVYGGFRYRLKKDYNQIIKEQHENHNH